MKGKVKNFLLVLGIMFVCSALLLLLLTTIIWKMDGGGKLLSGGVIAVYVISCILGGAIVGKVMGKQKFLWGMVIGLLYFVILLLIGIFVLRINMTGNVQIISGGMICCISGMVGGMFASGS